jgi:predicted ribosome-associated RNA-binding protein Tma20
LIYITDDYPAFVDATGKSDFFPTLYTLGAYPNIIPSLTLCEGVETFIFNGANLMWPGVADYSQLGDFVKEEIVAVRSFKGEFVAIAGLAISRKDLN